MKGEETFSIRWERQPGPGPGTPAGAPADLAERDRMAEANRPRIRLLVVDDDADLRELLVRRFERQGASVVAAGSGEEALARAAQARCDVALLDLHLPGMSGIDVLARLKERQP